MSGTLSSNNSTKAYVRVKVTNSRKGITTSIDLSKKFENSKQITGSNAFKFICVHNHPTGDPSPSENDIIVTKEIIKNAYMMGIKCIDHIIIGDNCYYSFKESTSLFDQN